MFHKSKRLYFICQKYYRVTAYGMRLSLFTMCIWQVALSSYAQTAEMDSLHQLIQSTVEDSNKVKSLNLLAHKYRGYNLDSTISIASRALTLSNKLTFLKGTSDANYYIGVAHTMLGRNAESLPYGDASLLAAEDLGDKGLQSRANNLLGTVYTKLENTDLASEHIYSAARLATENGDYKRSAYAYISLGSLWRHKDLAKATEHYQSALDNATKVNDERIIGMSYSLLGVMAYQQEDYALAIDYCKGCLIYAKRSGDQGQLSYCLKDLAEYYRITDQLDSARLYIDRAEERTVNLGINGLLADVYSIKGALLKNLGDRPGAIEYYKKGIALAQKDGIHFELYDSYQSLSKLQGEVGDYKPAYQNSLLALAHRDSMIYKTHADELSDANTKYETEKKEAEIARQELMIGRQENTRNVLIASSVGGLGLLGALFFGFYQSNQRKRKETELALQLEHERADDIQRVSKLKTDFFNNVSHELRTPLTLVIAPLQDAIDRVKNVQLKEELELALSNSKRLLNLTNEILDLSKIDGAKLTLQESTVSLFSFLSRVYHSFDSLAQTRDILLRDNIQSTAKVGIRTDADKLEKILTNLIANAIKYSDDGTEVHLDLDKEALNRSQLILNIRDHGAGIPEGEQDKVFDRFFQSSVAPQSSGTGIGLALVKELTEVLGGNVRLESTEGEGSTFTVEVPVELIEGLPEETLVNQVEIQKELPIPILISDDRPKVLIVEDDLEMSKYLLSLLEGQYDCDIAYNGKQALERVKRMKYDLISCDIMMPEMDGFEFREKLNQSEDLRSLPFIMLSARSLEEDKLKGFQLGIDDYITKPFSSAEYKARVYNLLLNKLGRAKVSESEETLISFDDDFINMAKQIVIDNIADSSFKVDRLAEQLNYSTRQVGRILQKTTGLSPVAFILEVRLQRAYRLISSRKYNTIKEVQYKIGIESASYFSSKFKERFGVSPGDLAV